jgi:hypothetical protein
MISHRHRCIFVEVPKTGSSSIRRILGEPAKPHLNLWQIKFEMESHWTYSRGQMDRIIASFYTLLSPKVRRLRGERQFEEYFKFGFVRNPWDRVVSLYFRKEGLQMRDRMTFENFVDWIQYSSSTCRHPVPHVNQLDWLVDPHGNVIADYIGRFENLEADWKVIAQRIGAPPELPHTNLNAVKPPKHYSSFYSEKTAAIIADKFRKDIAFFGYEFEVE